MKHAVDRQRRAVVAALGVSLLPRPSFAAAANRVIVVGAGFGGATCARYLRLLSPATEVLLIDGRDSFLTGPFSNLAIAGLRPLRSIRRDLGAIGRAHRVRTLHAQVTGIDPVRLRVTTDGSGTFGADRIVVAPGVAMRWDLIEGLTAANSHAMPHAWTGDAQVGVLRDRLAAVADGETILIGSPPNPYRCPPGPYERASLMAYRLAQTGRGRVKIVLADAKDDFTKSALFRLEWDTLYPGVIDWLPRAAGGEVVRVDTATGEVWLRGSATPLHTGLASIVPAQRAADLAVRADLVDESGWCPVDAADFQSTRHRGVHVIGDACLAAPMPKAAFAANSQAKLCACALAAAFAGAPAPEPRLLNTCYSMVSASAAISVSGAYGAVAGKLTQLSGGMSPLAAAAGLREREAREAAAWYAGITMDSFGRA
jgi:sulfide dehydrogenase [flavocytochrome c] flavoprotein subunit